MLSKVVLVVLSISIASGILLAGVEGFAYTKNIFSPQPKTPDAAPVDSSGIVIATTGSVHSIEQYGDVSIVSSLEHHAKSISSESESREILQSTSSSSEISTSIQMMDDGVISESWKSNSWGVILTQEASSKTMDVHFKNSWSAFSLYSNGISLKDLWSLEIEFSSATQPATPLYLALYQGVKRLGAVELSLYSAHASDGVLRVPLTDFDLQSHYITDVIIESESPARVAMSSMSFSSSTQSTKISKPTVVQEEDILVSGVLAPEAIAPISEQTIYSNGLKNGWLATARRGVLDQMNEERSVSGSAMKISFDTNTSALSLHHPSGVNTDKFSHVEFMVYGGTTDYLWQQLYVTAYDIKGNKLGTVDMAGYSGRGRLVNQQWEKFSIPLSAFADTGVIIATFDIENASITQYGDALWIDAVRFDSLFAR
jgi:hypothetical protein